MRPCHHRRELRFVRRLGHLTLIAGCLYCCLDCFCCASNPASSLCPHTGVALMRRARWALAGRGGDWNASPGPLAREALGDFRVEAMNLFSNLQRSATFAAGILVPLGFFAAPILSKDDTRGMSRVKRIHYLISTASLSCHLIAMMYSTIAVNKLTEVHSAPSRSVVHLLLRDYELLWVGSNVHFLLGILGMALSLITFGWIMFGPAARPASYMVGSVMLQMIAVANAGIGQGEGVDGGTLFAKNLPHLILKYFRLLFAFVVQSRSVMLVSAIGMAVYSFYQVADMLWRDASAARKEG